MDATMVERDPYTLLGVERSSSPEQVRAAFRELVRQAHPDTGSQSVEGPRVQELIDAYRTVMGSISERDLEPPVSGRRVRVRRGGGVQERAASAPCKRCSGSGEETRESVCDECNGRAEVTALDGRSARIVRCRKCAGRGTLRSTRVCADCDGSGAESP